MKLLLRKPLFFFFFLTLITFLSGSAPAQSLSGDQFIIETQEIEQKTYHPAPPVENSKNQRVTKTDNYQIVLGFEDIPSEDFNSIESSASIIDYGKFYPTNPVERAIDIKVNAKSAHGYSVLVFEDHPLSDPSFINLIPDTSCDRGLCSQSISAVWEDNLTYGLGYSCENLKGSSCVATGTKLFKKFPDESKGEEYEPVFENHEQEGKGEIIYKLNISASQSNSVYSNTTTYLLVPDL